jgi:2-oxoglutarate dehydrogenase E1 component
MLLSKRHLGGCFPEDKPLRCIARPYSASPAVGYVSLHLEQQQQIVDEALGLGEFAAAEQKKSA